MNRLGSVLAVGLFAFCANAGTINVTPSNMNGWTAENDGGTSSSFVAGPATAPLGTGSFQASLGTPTDSSAGVWLYTTAYDGLSLSSVTGLGLSTYESSASNGESFDIVLGLSNGDWLYFEPRYQGASDTVALDTWQSWSSSATTAGWYDQNNGIYGPPVESLATYADANAGVTIDSVGVQAGYLDPVWTGFVGDVDAFTITANGGINDTYNFDPNVATPEPSTWFSLGAGLLLVGFAVRRRISPIA
jgi:hypothetical protein